METLDGKFLGVYDPTKLEVYIDGVLVKGFGEDGGVSISNSINYTLNILPLSNVFNLLLDNYTSKNPLEIHIIYKDLSIDVKDVVVCSGYSGVLGINPTPWKFSLDKITFGE